MDFWDTPLVFSIKLCGLISICIFACTIGKKSCSLFLDNKEP